MVALGAAPASDHCSPDGPRDASPVGPAALASTVGPAALGQSRPCRPSGAGVCRFVDPVRGADGNPGTASLPFRTLQRAADVIDPGDVVIVADGVYTGGDAILELTRSGTPTDWIVIRAEHRWGAVLDGRDQASAIGVEIGGSYLRLEGFEIRGTGRYGVEVYHGHDVVVAENHVHDIGRLCTDEAGGRAGINAYAPGLVIERNVIHSIGRLGPGEGGCRPANAYWQNHDHGIYHGIGDHVVVRNNLFYDHTRGWAIQRYDGDGTVVDGLAIVNNTFVGGNPNRAGQVMIATPTRNLLIANNIFSRPNLAAIRVDGAGSSGTISNNLTDGTALVDGPVTGLAQVANRIRLDPGFEDPDGLDFHLRPDSPAIGAGVPSASAELDLDGTSRPAGSAPDLGAYQHRRLRVASPDS